MSSGLLVACGPVCCGLVRVCRRSVVCAPAWVPVLAVVWAWVQGFRVSPLFSFQLCPVSLFLALFCESAGCFACCWGPGLPLLCPGGVRLGSGGWSVVPGVLFAGVPGRVLLWCCAFPFLLLCDHCVRKS